MNDSTSRPKAQRHSAAGAGGGKKEQAQEVAQGVAQDAKGAAQSVAQTASQEAAGVAQDAKLEGRKLWDEAASTLSTQSHEQMSRAAGTARSVSDDLAKITRSEELEDGVVSQLASQAGRSVATAADWLENHEPADLIHEVQDFARRKPVAFLAIAGGLGFLAGRLTRGVAENHTDALPGTRHSSRTGSSAGSGRDLPANTEDRSGDYAPHLVGEEAQIAPPATGGQTRRPPAPSVQAAAERGIDPSRARHGGDAR